MKKRFASFRIYEAIIPVVLAIIMIGVGSKFDLSLSARLFKGDNILSKISGALGSLPFYTLLGACGPLMFFALTRTRGGSLLSKILPWVLLFLFPLVSGGLYGYQSLDDFISKRVLAMGIGIVAIGAITFGVFRLIRKSDPRECFFVFLTLVVSLAITFVLTQALKIMGARPRYSYVIEHPDAYRDWWVFDRTPLLALLEENPEFDKDIFDSFPSGHSALASVAVLFPLFAPLNRKLQKRGLLLFIIGALWSLLVGFGRILDGHHFLSDIGWGLLIGYVLSFASAYLIYEPAAGRVVDEPKKNERRKYKWDEWQINRQANRNATGLSSRAIRHIRRANNAQRVDIPTSRPNIALSMNRKNRK